MQIPSTYTWESSGVQKAERGYSEFAELSFCQYHFAGNASAEAIPAAQPVGKTLHIKREEVERKDTSKGISLEEQCIGFSDKNEKRFVLENITD